MKLFKQKNNSKGFTLLEILVVISIIGILIALGASAFSVAQRKSRDARRQGDIKAMQNAFEQYYATNNSTYTDCAMMAVDTMPGGLPNDPKSGSYVCEQTVDGGYCACAMLEDSDGNAGADCDYDGTGYFCVSNLQ